MVLILAKICYSYKETDGQVLSCLAYHRGSWQLYAPESGHKTLAFVSMIPLLPDVAMQIDGVATNHWAMEALRNSASEVYHQCFAKNMVVDT